MKIPPQVISRAILNSIKWNIFKNPSLETIIPKFYITHKCNINCSYCDDGTGESYPEKKTIELDTNDTKKLLGIIRKKHPIINITGGEPLIRRDINEILSHTKDKLKYKYVILNTNGLLIEKKWDCLKNIDHLVISLDSLNPVNLSLITNTPICAAKKILRNIDFINKNKPKHLDITINNVILPSTLKDSKAVMQYCFDNNITYSPMPCVVNGKDPHPGLVGNHQYQSFINEIISLKRSGYKVFNTTDSLKKIVNFDPYTCLPTLVSEIHCDGSLFYPCSPLETISGNLLDSKDWDTTVNFGIKKHGKFTMCKHSCPVSCYMEPSSLIRSPFSAIKQYLL